MKVIDIMGIPKMGKWQLAWWRFKRLFQGVGEEYVILGNYNGVELDLPKLFESAHEYNMSLEEFVNYILLWYMKNTTPEQMKKDMEEFKKVEDLNKKLDTFMLPETTKRSKKSENKPLTMGQVTEELFETPEPMKKKDYDALPVSKEKHLGEKRNRRFKKKLNKDVDDILNK